jgi:hypothetical protein
VNKEKLAEAFVKAGILDQEEARRLLEENRRAGDENLEDTLLRLKFATEEETYKVLADTLGVPFLPLSGGLDPKAVALIPLNLASNHAVFPVREEDGALWLAMKNPWDTEALDLARFAAGMPVKPFLAPREPSRGPSRRTTTSRTTSRITRAPCLRRARASNW